MEDRTGSTFLIGPDLGDPRTLVTLEGARYAATLSGGLMLAAFDHGPERGAYTPQGNLWIEAAEPDYPDTWPDWARPLPRGPKRKVGTGSEAFALLHDPGSSLVDLYRFAVLAVDDLQGASIVRNAYGEGRVLVETSRPPLGLTPWDPYAEWIGVVDAWHDARLGAPEPSLV